eukprot:gene13412-14746_t
MKEINSGNFLAVPLFLLGLVLIVNDASIFMIRALFAVKLKLRLGGRIRMMLSWIQCSGLSCRTMWSLRSLITTVSL